MSDPLAGPVTGTADETCPEPHPRPRNAHLYGRAAARLVGYWSGAALGGLVLGAAAAVALSGDNLRRIRSAERRVASTLTKGAGS